MTRRRHPRRTPAEVARFDQAQAAIDEVRDRALAQARASFTEEDLAALRIMAPEPTSAELKELLSRAALYLCHRVAELEGALPRQDPAALAKIDQQGRAWGIDVTVPWRQAVLDAILSMAPEQVAEARSSPPIPIDALQWAAVEQAMRTLSDRVAELEGAS